MKDFSSTSLHASRSDKTPIKKVLKIWIIIVAILIIAIFSFALVSAFKGVRTSLKNATITLISKQVWTEMQRDQYGNVNVLLLGYGWVNHDGGYLTDSIIVASRNPEQGNISMFSIPRDLYVKSPITQGYGRINTIFTQFMGRNKKDIHASASGTVAEIATMLGMDIPYYATIDFTAFEGIIDAIGGIDIVIPETLHDTAYPNKENRGYITFHIDAGLQHLDGATALKYARSRYSTSDFSRSLRQQLIIMGIKDKLFGSGISLSVAQELYEQYKTYITTNVSLPEMLRTVQYLNTLKDFTSFGFTTNCSFQNYLKMPAACFLYYPDREAFGGASVMLPMGASVNVIQHYQQMQTFTHFILSNPTFIKQKATIEILNGIDKSLARWKGMASTPFAGQLAVKLKRYGFNIVNTENASTPLSKSYISINNVGEYDATLQAIQTFLPITDIRYATGMVTTGRDENGNEITIFDGKEISIYLGEDYLLGSEVLSGLVQKKFSYELQSYH